MTLKETAGDGNHCDTAAPVARVAGWTHQQVLRLDVPVDDVQAVQVLDGAGQVEEHAAGVPLCVLVGGSDGVKEVPSLEKAKQAKVRRTATDFSGPKIKKICIE